MSATRTSPIFGSPTGACAPAPGDRNALTIGPDGPILLHDVHVLEQMAHFNREKTIERQPHAKGSGAFGVFETTEDVSAYTRAALFQKGAVTDMLARFSTVAGEQGSPDTWRDVRGFSLKRSEEHTSELQSLMRISYAVFCLKKKKKKRN